jgi:dipeptidyl aminopeptidase/acylaminoacyl peptidase
LSSTQAERDRRIEIANAHWGPRFVANGVTMSDFHEVTSGIDRWDRWCDAWSTRASVHEALGHEALAAGCGLSAAEHLTRAGVCYHFAKFLFVHDPDAMRRAHRKAIDCRQLALPHLAPPGERVQIPFAGTVLAGILRRPRGIARPPLVVMIMGLDSAKEEMDAYETTFLDRGMATLAFDGPGQGEAEYELPIRGDYEVPVAAVLDWVEQRHDVDAARVGLWGVSLGGYYAPRAAAFDKRAKACVTLSGPYDWSDGFDERNELTREAFRVRARCATMEEARDAAGKLSLAGVAARITCPLYIVAGDRDTLTPPRHAQRLAAEASGPVVLSIVPGGTHVVNNRSYRYRPQTADWMASQLGARAV